MNKVWFAGVLSLLLAAPPSYAQDKQPPAGKARGGQRGGPIVLNADDVPAFPDPPAGAARPRPADTNGVPPGVRFARAPPRHPEAFHP